MISSNMPAGYSTRGGEVLNPYGPGEFWIGRSRGMWFCSGFSQYRKNRVGIKPCLPKFFGGYQTNGWLGVKIRCHFSLVFLNFLLQFTSGKLCGTQAFPNHLVFPVYLFFESCSHWFLKGRIGSASGKQLQSRSVRKRCYLSILESTFVCLASIFVDVKSSDRTLF